MSAPKNDIDQDKSSFQTRESDIDGETTLPKTSQERKLRHNRQNDPVPTDLNQSALPEQATPKSVRKNVTETKGGEIVKVETKSPKKQPKKAFFHHLQTQTVAILVGSAVMLPILAVGTATYYFGSQTLNKQAILAKRFDNLGLAETELARQQKLQQLLAALLIGTGTTALLTGAIAAWGTKRLLDSRSKISTKEIEEEDETYVNGEFIQNSNQSVSQPNILKAIVEEARNYLNCDRVVVYSLNQDRYGVVVAESVAPDYTQALGRTIVDPCFEAKYLKKYRDGRVRAIDNIYEAKMTPCYLEQLEQLEVKANLVTPILNQDKLFGLLVAHQCKSSRKWQKAEINFLLQLAQKADLTLENAKLLDDIIRLRARTKKERRWTHHFTDATQYIRQSLKQNDVLDISVEEVRRVLKCDRVVIYSLNQAQYGVVIAESLAPGYPRALNKTISDPCFAARYLDKYRDGRVRAIDNIQEAGMTKCYVEQLETLDVKANLVTPILNEGKLFGLLVAHQCNQPRHWQNYEIRWMTQIATQVGFALDNAKLLAESTRQQAQAERERKWTNYFTDATQYIRQSLKQHDVLDISVEEVRRVLECDRVVIYSLNQDRYGVVIAESLAPGYPRALNRKIEDPCFEARYLDKYRDGRVRAIDNIHEAGMTKCYIQQLETLEVKANLVTPILNEGQLFGLLVAHQCSQPRHWQDYEIRWMTQIATQVGFALDNAKILAESTRQQAQAERERKWTNYFTDAIQYIRQSLSQDDVLDISVEEVRRVLECDRVVVYSLNQDRYGVVIAESIVPGYPRALNRIIKDPCFEAKYLEQYRDGRVRAISNIREAGMTKCYIEQLETLEVKANLVTPILNEGKLFGLLVAHQCSQPRHWQDYEIRWMTQIATQVGFALDNAALLKRFQNDSLATQLLKNFSLDISEGTNTSDLLKIAVEQARKIVKLDRVIVYQFDADWNGNIVAESLTTGYPRGLNTLFKDPCFGQEYGEKYRQGRIKAIADIYQANLTTCHLEQLESLAVKASLVVPILQDERLFGLLIGHQCEQPHQWEQSEIDLFAQLALQLGFALERFQLKEELELAQQNHNHESDEQQLELLNFQQKISELIAENKAALQDLKTQINDRSVFTNDFTPQTKAIKQQHDQKSSEYSLREKLRNGVRNSELARGSSLFSNEPNSELLTTNSELERSDLDSLELEPKMASEELMLKSNNQQTKDITTVQEEIQGQLSTGDHERLYQEAIAEAKEKVEVLNQSNQNLYQMVSLINDMKAGIERSSARETTPDQLEAEES
ncbi:GAF domain-containing protein [Pleurocapsa sp. PCC 7319]|uniref:GAF domain-containing protein n=1 Tax=Pleurocapsa sp. PCC 7319 TaxID=118161 RepID=UPI00034A9C40|nr:GAF domain-containing protein [Pleurocapsa sp. PCC 7319]